jgi:hypothetical protein
MNNFQINLNFDLSGSAVEDMGKAEVIRALKKLVDKIEEGELPAVVYDLNGNTLIKADYKNVNELNNLKEV